MSQSAMKSRHFCSAHDESSSFIAQPAFEQTGLAPEPLQSWIGRRLGVWRLKALKKEPSERYASAEQLAEDLRRYLRGFPVRARPDTTTYRIRKFARRHR
jgi:eukaryotic-like serine/threonine-protein kinase